MFPLLRSTNPWAIGFRPLNEGRCWDGHDGCYAPRILRRRGAQAHRQRLQHSGRDGQRFRLAELKHRPVAQHFPDGRARLRQEHVPLEHRRTAHLVHHSRQQAWLHRPQEGNRFPGGDESRDRAGRHHVAGAGRRRALRRAAEPAQAAQRSDLLRRPLRQARRRGLPRSQAAQAGQEHGLRRRGGAAARPSTWPKSRRRCASSSPRR